MFILLGFDVKTENRSKSYFDFRTTYETGLKFSTYLGSYNIIRFTIDLQKRVEVYLLFQIGFKKDDFVITSVITMIVMWLFNSWSQLLNTTTQL